MSHKAKYQWWKLFVIHKELCIKKFASYSVVLSQCVEFYNFFFFLHYSYCEVLHLIFFLSQLLWSANMKRWKRKDSGFLSVQVNDDCSSAFTCCFTRKFNLTLFYGMQRQCFHIWQNVKTFFLKSFTSSAKVFLKTSQFHWIMYGVDDWLMSKEMNEDIVACVLFYWRL